MRIAEMVANQKIEVANFAVYLPIMANGTRPSMGTVAELLNTGFSVQFDGYPNTVDYSASEARFFRKA